MYEWNKSRMILSLVVSISVIFSLIFFALKLDSIWNWILAAGTAFGTLYVIVVEKKVAKKRVSGNNSPTEFCKSRKATFATAVLLLLTVITVITDLLILYDITSVDSVHSTLSEFGVWLIEASIKCAFVVAAFAITLWVICKFLYVFFEDMEKDDRSCQDCIIILLATGFESYYLGNNIADHFIAMI